MLGGGGGRYSLENGLYGQKKFDGEEGEMGQLMMVVHRDGYGSDLDRVQQDPDPDPNP